MKFNDIYNHYKGHLEIYKVYKDGTSELFYEEDNVVCSGMGTTLAEAFAANKDALITNYQVTLFQLGTGGTAGLQVSSNGRLGTALDITAYGTGALGTVTQNLSASSTVYTGEVFGVIPNAFIDKVSARKVRWRIIVDEDVGNSNTLNEVGLFSKNPGVTTPTPTAFLCAYRNFGDLAKTSEFALDIRWTIEF